MNNDISKLKSLQAEMLSEVIKICNKHNIKYFLCGGTLIGAIRHEGFIPWDDDIDIGLPREDYEKFLSLAQDELPQYLFLQTHETDKNCPMNYAKIRNSNTTFIELSTQNLDMNHGVYIDVFVFDGFPSDKKIAKKVIHKRKILDLKISKVFYKEKTKSKSLKTNIMNIWIKYFVGKNVDKYIKQKDILMKKYKYSESENIFNYCGAWGSREVALREWFDQSVEKTFENIKVACPEGYDSYLTKIYGDYMQLPPEEKRIGHHYCKVIDLDKSYKEYMNIKGE